MFFVFFVCLFVSKTKNENLLPFFVYLQKKIPKNEEQKSSSVFLFSCYLQENTKKQKRKSTFVFRFICGWYRSQTVQRVR